MDKNGEKYNSDFVHKSGYFKEVPGGHLTNAFILSFYHLLMFHKLENLNEVKLNFDKKSINWPKIK